MVERCSKCGSDRLIKGDLVSTGWLVFVPYEQPDGPVRQCSSVTAVACKNCGAVFGFELTDMPVKLTDR
ncbi:MAG: hypothetical protein IK093_18285 [Ruminiclostridium sp.]|nr:hypothetical protein [Ruminiclostridium sp.]